VLANIDNHAWVKLHTTIAILYALITLALLVGAIAVSITALVFSYMLSPYLLILMFAEEHVRTAIAAHMLLTLLAMIYKLPSYQRLPYPNHL
jgi:hypothetical protein